MTAQVSDQFTYRHKEYQLAGLNGRGLFDPRDHGMRLTAPHTACWRGFNAHYAVQDRQLRLKGLRVHASEVDTLPLLLYGAPLQLFDDDDDIFHHMGFDGTYQDCPDPVPFTGGLLLADGFIEDLYVHMGFHPAWKYHEVHELVFEKGNLVKENDRSVQAAELRARQTGLKPRFATMQEHLEWIQRCFDLRYDGLE